MNLSRMRVRHLPLGVIALALPLAVEVEVPSDSSVTQLRVAAGGGHYVALVRDCDGNVTNQADGSFYDVAAGVDHKFGGSPWSIGLSGGYLHDEGFPGDSTQVGVAVQNRVSGYYYVSPSIGLTWRRFAIAVGATRFSRKLLNPNDVFGDDYDTVNFTEESDPDWFPSAAIRIGPASDLHFTASLFSAFPMYSGGGYFDFGFGDRVSERVSLWGGVSLAGMTATAFQTRVQWRVKDQLYLDAGGSIGRREEEMQYGGSIGVTYRVVH